MLAGGRYVIQQELGRGGMGVVYRALDQALGRPVAIKMVAGESITERTRERLLREARAVAQLSHPGIVAVHEVAEEAGRPYLVMDLVQGEVLEALGERGERPGPRRLAGIVRQVALGLAHAHERGIVHRDVKPSNVILDGDGRARLLDFGLARALENPGDLTASGQLVGTPQFMAPEQVRGEAVGPFTDVYALGGLLYWGLLGRPPAEGSTVIEIVGRVVHRDPDRPRLVDSRVHPDLETIAMRCLEKDPARRYASASEVADELARFLAGEAILARPLSALARLRRLILRNRLAAAAALVVLLVCVAALAMVVASRVAARREVAAEAARFRERVRERARKTADAFAAARREPPPEGETTAQARARSDRLLALGLDALAATTALALAPGGGGGARPEAARLALDVGDVALGAEQWSVAASAFERAIELDDGLAATGRARLADLDQARDAAARAQRAAVGDILDRVRSGELLARPDGRADAVFEIVRYPGPPTVEVLVAELDAISAALRDVTRATLLALATPTEAETRAGKEPIPGLEEHVERFVAMPLEARPDDPLHGAIAEACRRLQARERAARAEGTMRERRWDEVLADEQARALGREQLELARLCCEALGRLGLAEHGAFEALCRYLASERDGGRAAAAAVALCRIGGDRAQRAILDAQVRFQGTTGPFWRAVTPYLEHAEGETPLIEESAAGFVKRGLARHARGELDAAIADFTRAIELDPGHASGWSNRGCARQAKGDPRGAIADFDRAIALEPRNASLLGNRALARHESGDLPGALADYDRAVALDPNDAITFANRGHTRQSALDLDGAIADYDRAVALDPELSIAWLNRGNAKEEKGDLPGAIADYGRAIELEPLSGRAWANRGRVRAASGDPDGALADFDRAVEVEPDEPLCWRMRALARRERGDLPGALADLDRAVALLPDYSNAVFDRAVTRQRAGDLRGAIEDLTRCIELEPRHAPLTLVRRGEIRKADGDVPGAIADFTRAIELAPELSDGWGARGVTRADAGEREAAIADLERFLRLEPRGPRADGVRGRLAQLRAGGR